MSFESTVPGVTEDAQMVAAFSVKFNVAGATGELAVLLAESTDATR